MRSITKALWGAGIALCVTATATVVGAQTYPMKPITLMIGFPKGGPNDILGRLAAGWLSQKLGQPVEVENRGGSSGNIATEAVVKAAPDGYTLLLVGPANAISGSNPGLPFNFLRDIAQVGGITREALVLVVHPSVAARSAMAGRTTRRPRRGRARSMRADQQKPCPKVACRSTRVGAKSPRTTLVRRELPMGAPRARPVRARAHIVPLSASMR